MRLLFLGFLLLNMIVLNAQQSINDYKYIIVPEGYSAFKGDDAYQLNSLTKFLFKKFGFSVISQNDKLPDDLINNGCKGLITNVKKNSTLFNTKLTVELKDCNGLAVFTSSEGQSREKEYKKAYQEALRNAFKSIQNLNYKYSEKIEEGIVYPKESKNKYPALLIRDKEVIPVEEIINYEYNGVRYSLKKNIYGYDFFKYQNESFTLLGKIYKTSRSNNYIIKGKDSICGLGYFDSQSNFILERIHSDREELLREVFVKQ